MLYGLNKDEAMEAEPETEKIEETKSGTVASVKKEDEQAEKPEKATVAVEMEEPDNLTQKTASFMEAGVKGFYEAIVQIMYQISQVFF